MGRVQPGGAIEGRLVFSNGVQGVLEVEARVAVGGEYRGFVRQLRSRWRILMASRIAVLTLALAACASGGTPDTQRASATHAASPTTCAMLPATTDTAEVVVYAALGPSSVSGTDWHRGRRVLRPEQERELVALLDLFRARFPADALVPTPLTLPTDVEELEHVKKADRSVPSLASGTTFTWHRDGRITGIAIDRSSRSAAIDMAIVRTLSNLGVERAVAGLRFDDVVRARSRADSISLRLEMAFHRDSAVATISLATIRAPAYHETPAVAATAGPAPRYPSDLLEQSVEGEVLAEFLIDTAGRVDPKSVAVRKMTRPAFGRAVIDVLPQMRFRPHRLNGCLVEAVVLLPFAFKVRDRY